MKINNIKINSYGNIQDKEMKFTDGINIIKGKNESGKSTILNYIVSMFYGISKNKDGNKLSDYEKYKPWRGEEFSGKIEYNLDSGEKFEVFRDFNKKNPQIYNENYENISDKYNVNKKDGNQFFLMQTNVEKPMYLSTVVSTQQDVRLDEKNQNMLVQKIANLAGTGEDNVSYKKAVTKLQEKIRDEIGTSKTSLKPINIAQNELNNIEMEIRKIEPYENEKYSIDEEKNKAKKEVESLENEKKLAVDLKAIYEEQNTTIQELELKKKDKTDNLYNLNILQDKEKTYEKSKEEILKNLQEADEIKKAKEAELENLAEEEEPKKRENNSVFFIIELLLIILLILNVFFIKLNVINICSAVVILLTFVIHIIKVSQIKNKNKKILAENARKLEQQRVALTRKIQEVDSDIQLLQNEEKSNNEELSMAKGKIELLAKKINEEIASIGDMEEKLKNNLNTSKEILEEKYNQEIGAFRLAEILGTENINYELQSIENKLNTSVLKLKTLEIEEKNILPQLEKLIVLKEKQVSTNERIEELKQYQKIINIALENLSEAYEEMKTTITPKFTQNLSQNMSKISNGKYDKVSINDETGMIVENKNGEYVEAYKLSTGTIDQLYLSLRLSMIDEISKEKLPIILDETFAYFDDERIKNILEYVINDLKERQTIIFTCSNREIEILKELKLNYNLIEI